MRRRLAITCAVVVAVGSLINLAIAWLCAGLVSPHPMSIGADPLLLARVRREFFDRVGPDPGGSDPGILFVSVAHEAFGVQFLDAAVEDDDIPTNAFSGPLPYIGYVRAGWPFLSFESEVCHDASRGPRPLAPEVRGGIPLHGRYISANRLFIGRMLPLRPLWPGFALGAVFWSVVIAAIGIAFNTARRWRRRRLGLCLACGYPMRALNVCSECGRHAGPQVRPLDYVP